MTPREAVVLATVVQAYFPSQPISEYTPDALHELLEPYALEDCRVAIKARAMRLKDTEGQKWCAPTDVYAEIRRIRSKAIASDEPIPMPADHDPDDVLGHIRILVAGRQAQVEGRELVEDRTLVRRSIRELGGPVRRVNELDEDERLARVEQTKVAHRAARTVLAATPEPEVVAVVFACEHVVDKAPCGQPAPHLSADRRKPLCGAHREPTATPDRPESLPGRNLEES